MYLNRSVSCCFEIDTFVNFMKCLVVIVPDDQLSFNLLARRAILRIDRSNNSVNISASILDYDTMSIFTGDSNYPHVGRSGEEIDKQNV